MAENKAEELQMRIMQ